MKKRLALALSCLLFVPLRAVTAEDTQFLSLTRDPVPLSKLPTNVSVMTEADIRRTGAETLDQAIDRLPGVDVYRTGTVGSFATVRLRGVPASAQTQLVIDDQPIGGVSNQFIDLARFPVDNIERIEVVRGASSVLYGANTIGGVIHVITKRRTADGAGASLGFEAGSFDTNIVRASAGGMSGRWDAFGTFTHYRSDGFQKNGGSEDLTGSLSSGYSFGGGARVGLEVQSSNHESGNPKGTGVPVSEWNGTRERTPAEPNAYTRQENTLARVRGEVPVADLGTLKSVVFLGHQDYRSYARHGAASFFDQINRIAGNDTRFRFFNGLTIGGSYERDDQDTVGSDPVHVTNWAAYAQHEWKLGNLSLIPAVRHDEHSEFGGVTNPRFTAIYAATPWWSVSANAARSFRAPSFLELFFKSPFGFNGNPDLDPERAWTYDLGNRFRVLGREDVAVTAFFTKIDDRIAAGLSTYENVDQAEIKGIELEASGIFGPIHHRLSYTALDARGTSGARSEFVPLRLTPRQTASASLTWRPGRVAFTNEVRYVGEQFRLDDERGARLPAYGVWNARVDLRAGPAEFAVGVDNILEERYGESFDNDPVTFATTLNPQPGRTVWGSAGVRFGQ